MSALSTDEVTIKSLWEKLERYLRQHDPELLADLNTPATCAEVAILEGHLGFSLPNDFIECIKIHNGQKGKADWLFDGEEFLSTTLIFKNWSMLNRLREQGDFNHFVPSSVPAVKDAWWLPRWLPFTSNGAGDYACLDLDPAPRGTSGQIINFFHDLGERSVKAPSFTLWFRQFVNSVVD